jgi:hypothetical protein
MAIGASAPVIAVAGVIGFHQLTSPSSKATFQTQPLVISKTDLRRIARSLKYFSEDLERKIRDAEWHDLKFILHPDAGRVAAETAKDWVLHAKRSAGKLREAVRVMSRRGVEEITIKPPLKPGHSPAQPIFSYTNLVKIRRYLQYFSDNLMTWIKKTEWARRWRTVFHPVIGPLDLAKAERMVSDVNSLAEKIDKLVEMMLQEGVEELNFSELVNYHPTSRMASPI